jgi:hypothetical protein
VVKILAFRVRQRGARSLEELVELIYAQPLERRTAGAARDIRLEKRRQARGGLLLLDFAHKRSGHGPGRASRNDPVTEFDLGAEEFFAEDTAVVYDPRSHYAAVQHNHYGPRVGTIERYLYAWDVRQGIGPAVPGVGDQERAGFTFGAVLKPDAYARLRGLGIVRQIDFSVSVPGAREADLDEGRSLGQVLRAALPEGIETLSMTMTAQAPRNSALGQDGIWGSSMILHGSDRRLSVRS